MDIQNFQRSFWMGTLFYLSSVLNQKYLTALARFRTSCHRLAIETGRYHKPPIPSEQRFCCICNTGDRQRVSFTSEKSKLATVSRESLRSSTKNYLEFNSLSREKI